MTSMMTFELIPVKELTAIAKASNRFPVDFDDAWQWIEYARKDSALRTLQANFEQGVDFNLHKKKEVQFEGNREVKRTINKYYLTVDCFKSFCMMAGTEKGKAVRKYYLDLEKQFFTKDIRQKSVDCRNAVTAGWKRQGLTEPHEYGTATKITYLNLFKTPNIRKKDMNRDQVLALSALEAVEALKYNRLPENTLKLPGIAKSLEDTAQLLEIAAGGQPKQIGGAL